MQGPDVQNTIRDTNGNTFHIMAYRELSHEEMVITVRQFYAQPSIRRKRKPPRNQTFRIITVYGATPNL